MKREQHTEGVTERLANFTVRASFDDLPQEVVEKTKLILLDDIGCALGSYVVDRARVAVNFAKKCGGNPQASIIGSHRTSCDLAAFVNGELINALDYDCVGPISGHVTPYVTPPCLAVAEQVHASGKELITALALAHEIGGRFLSSLVGHMVPRDEPPYYEESPRFSHSFTIFGGAAGAGKLLDLDARELSNVFGIVGASVPVPAGTKWVHITEPVIMVKYNAWSGWVARLATTAALLAETGFTGDSTILDGEWGFWNIVGSPFFKVENLLGGLGEIWHIRDVQFKLYPCCYGNHPGIEAIDRIVRKHSIKPEEIEQILAKVDPFLMTPVRMRTEIATFADTQFLNTYIFAVAAYYVGSPGPEWQMPATFSRPAIRALMERVKMELHPRLSDLMAAKIRAGKPPHFWDTLVEIRARGERFSEEISAPKGSASNPLTEAELLEKFRHNASYSMITSRRAEEIIEATSELDKVDDIAQFAGLLTMD